MSIIGGGSAAFGVGASVDSMTISSLLFDRVGHQGYNLGDRAFHSTQELQLFQKVFPIDEGVKTIILFSGVDDLYLALSKTCNPMDLCFPVFYQSLFKEGMEFANSGRLTKIKNLISGTIFNLQRQGSSKDWWRTADSIVISDHIS